MPRAVDRRTLWLGFGDAWAWIADLASAIGVCGGIGFGLDRWFGTWPIFFAIGFVGGYAMGVYILWRRLKERSKGQGARV
jgi:F0F1-type ATP synthase assembly protein I